MDASNVDAGVSKASKAYLDIAAAGKTNREVALKLAELGLPTFPCRATPKLDGDGKVKIKAKSPLVPKPGVYLATTDRRQIEAWWDQSPDALPGLPTGERTGIWVLDVDAPGKHREDGLKNFAELTAKHGEPVTFTVATSGGGIHYYFEWEAGLGNSTGRLPKGMEARGNGGYVIAPGARLPEGTKWRIEQDFRLAAIPGWLRGYVKATEHYESKAAEPSEGETEAGLRELARLCDRLSRSPNGNYKQHEELYWISAAVGNFVGGGEILRETAERELLAAGWRMENLVKSHPWTESELLRHIRNGLKNGVTKPRHTPETQDADDAAWWAANTDPARYIAAIRMVEGDAAADAEQARLAADEPATDNADAERLRRVFNRPAEPPPTAEAAATSKPKNKKKAKAKTKGDGAYGFSMTQNALWKLAEGDDPPMRVSQPFELLGLARSAPNARGETDSWGVLIRFRNHDGKVRDVIIGHADLHSDVGPLCASLADKGMDIERGDTARKAFAIYLLKAGSAARVTLAPRTGWATVAGERVFILPSESIAGNAPTENVILAANANCSCDARGTLEAWKAGAATFATGNVLAVLSISSAFASPLLRLSGYESGGIHLWGPSSIGKTTLARLCASVWARGDETGGLRSWRATANGLEGTLAGASDIGLVFDEISQVDGGELYHMIYMIAGGVGKARMNRDTSLRKLPDWKLLAFSTGEFPIETKLTEDNRRGRKPRAGQSVRMVDVKVARGYGAFDDLKGMTAVDLAAKCKTEAITNYGTAGPAFVRALVDNGVTGDVIRTLVSAFTDNVLKARRAANLPLGQIERVAERLGVIAVAGELAGEFGIVPWASGEATRAAAKALELWIGARGGEKPFEEDQAVTAVRNVIEAHGDSRFDVLDREYSDTDLDTYDKDKGPYPVRDRLGYRKGKGETQRWLVFPEAWKKVVCAGLDAEFVAGVLRARKMLEAGNDRGHPNMKAVKVSGKTKWLYVVTPEIFEG